ncbi:MAG: WYL domain-containing protein [Actinocatenispora sp.]
MRASRLISLLLLLQSRGRMTAPQLAVELAVSERTVYRDVQALAEAGIPVYAEHGRDGGYRLVEGYRTRLTGLTRGEAEALFLSGAQAPAADLGLSDALAAAQLKVLAALPAELRDVSGQVTARFWVDTPAWFRPASPPPHLSTVARGVWTDRVLTARYRRGDQEVDRRIEPYGLVLKNAVWYLAGRVGGAVRVYRVDRFTEVTATDEPFAREPGFDLGGFWADRAAAFERSIMTGTATVRLSPEGARALRYAVDRTSAADALAGADPPDEYGWVTVRLAIESVPIAHQDLLRLGVDAEVLAPPELRAMIADTVRTLDQRYS